MLRRLRDRRDARALVDDLTLHLDHVLGSEGGRALRVRGASSSPPEEADIVLVPTARPVESRGLTAAFTGLATPLPVDTDRAPSHGMPLTVLDRWGTGGHVPAPDGFTVLAVVPAFNEADVILGTIRSLVEQGISVHLVDNWSTDGTPELVRKHLPEDRVAIERFPAREPKDIFDLRAMLARIDAVTAGSHADWVMRVDADEICQSPWPDRNLKDALYTVERAGFNCVDHTRINFRPVEGEDHPGDAVEAMRWFEWGMRAGDFTLLRAWQRKPEGVDLLASGGHAADFAGRRVFPYKFLIRHYPIRSQEHGERKIFAERTPRWSPAERALGWHNQYDEYGPGASFLWNRDELFAWDVEEFHRRWLVQRISGVGLPRLPSPTA